MLSTFLRYVICFRCKCLFFMLKSGGKYQKEWGADLKRKYRFLVVLAVVALGLAFFAFGGKETAIKVYVNDAEINTEKLLGNPDAIIYNGTPYVSAEAVGKAFGQKVTWDKDAGSVYIGTHRADNEAAQEGNIKLLFGKDSITKDLTVEAYRLKHETGAKFLFLVIENHSDQNLRLSADLKFYNETGALIGADSREVYAIEKKTKTVIDIYLDYAEEKYDSVECVLTAEEERDYSCLTTKLSYKTAWTKYREIVSVTNNSDITAENVEGYLFFFKKGKLVDVASAYFGNNDFDINPGQTVTREMSRRKDYDSVEFYFTGYGKPIAKEGNG